MKRTVFALVATVICATSLCAQTPAKRVPARPARPAAAQPSLLNPASLKAKAPEVWRARFTTTKGDVVIEVTRAWAPLGVDRFYNLVKNHYYDGAAFFRVLPGFVAQFGISSRPAVSKVWTDAKFPDDPVKESNLRGYLTFATAGPNTRTTQIFINLADNPRLDGIGFAPFAKVVEGMDVVEQFYTGYGEGAPRGNGPDQGRMTGEGKAYIDKNFPLLDSIKTAVVLTPAAPATPAATAPKKVTTATKPVAATRTAKPATTTKEKK
jgi:peptidyl-prolyl cis-trans isomerase A (cyclophilin A)